MASGETPVLGAVVVTGEGSAAGVPDLCVVQAAVVARGEDAAEAMLRLGDEVGRALAALDAAGVPRAKVRTTDLALGERIDRTTGLPTGHEATYDLEVVVEPLDRMSEVLTALVQSVGDPVEVRRVRLSTTDPEPLRRQARRLAMEDARSRAEQLAEAAGRRIGAVRRIEEAGTSPGRMLVRAAPVAAGLPLEPGQLTLSCQVIVTYELEG
ncbi:MAG TPA: SIMPL domain-containing protein [Acidimicrobiales bacterium]|nr:SIMPL domain-containing protein [Acidimicrobiales bacterium]